MRPKHRIINRRYAFRRQRSGIRPDVGGYIGNLGILPPVANKGTDALPVGGSPGYLCSEFEGR